MHLTASYDTIVGMTITQSKYAGLQKAYDVFNRELFNKELPQCLITLQRKSRALGYFSPERFAARNSEGTAHELAMNPDYFGRTDTETLSTLAHEMAHVWQQALGTPPRRCYHDRQWAAKMREIGLQPSDTAEPGGAETGQRMSHYIVEGGKFARVAAKPRM